MSRVAKNPVPAPPADHTEISGNGRYAIQAEIDRRAQGQRLTPAQRRIAQCLTDRSAEIGFLSSMELAELADVSQPSVTRFAIALGFDGYLDMRKNLRAGTTTDESAPDAPANRFQAAILAEAANLYELAQSLANDRDITEIGKMLATSRPLTVLGLRVSASLATHFGLYAAKVHPDVRVITAGGSMLEDELEQCHAAGGRTLLVFMLPLYPKETIHAMEFARQLGMQIVLVSDAAYSNYDPMADKVVKARTSSKLVFDSSAAFTALAAGLLDAMCSKMPAETQKRLEAIDRSSKRRKVFAG